jgi:hypothetical protein
MKKELSEREERRREENMKRKGSEASFLLPWVSERYRMFPFT